MTDVSALLICLSPLLDVSTYRQLLIISQTMLMMTGRITMLGISRWIETGCSYRTVQRFFAKKISWDVLNWTVVKPFLKQYPEEIIIAGDATTVTKSGKKTFGLGRFFSSIYSRTVPGIAFQTLSLLNTKTRKSWPILIEQILPKPKQKKSTCPKKKRKRKSEAGADQKAQKIKISVMLNSMLK